MVNTVAVCLMVTSSEGLEKIRRLVNYWMLKIEEEEFGDDEYDYPKYLLRTTLCNILSGLAKHDECLRTANLNIKEISGDVDYIFKAGQTEELHFTYRKDSDVSAISALQSGISAVIGRHSSERDT